MNWSYTVITLSLYKGYEEKVHVHQLKCTTLMNLAVYGSLIIFLSWMNRMLGCRFNRTPTPRLDLFHLIGWHNIFQLLYI